MITEEIINSLQGVIPGTIVTADVNGVPNVSIISQAFPVDDNHLAISHQFFSKTFKNLDVNPFAFLQVIEPETSIPTFFELKLVRIEREGPLFDAMEMQLDVIASMSGMSDVFKLQSSYVFEVLSVSRMPEAIANG